MTNGNLYLVYSQRGYWTFTQLVDRVIKAQKNWEADFIAVEKASSGIALLEVLWEHYRANIRRKLVQPIEVSPKLSKEDRAGKAMVTVSQGLVHIPTAAPWLDDFLAELGAFPASLDNDQVDAFSQAVHFFRLLLKSRYNPLYKGSGRVLTKW
jgi:predicted phage terminase large subunit-like protein